MLTFGFGHSNLLNITIPNQNKHFPLYMSISNLFQAKSEFGSTKSFNENEQLSECEVVPIVYQFTPSLREEILKKGKSMLLQFHGEPNYNVENVHLLIWVPSSCSFEVSIQIEKKNKVTLLNEISIIQLAFKVDWLGALTQMMRSYAVLIGPMLFAIALLTIRRQLSKSKIVNSNYSQEKAIVTTIGLSSASLSPTPQLSVTDGNHINMDSDPRVNNESSSNTYFEQTHVFVPAFEIELMELCMKSWGVWIVLIIVNNAIAKSIGPIKTA